MVNLVRDAIALLTTQSGVLHPAQGKVNVFLTPSSLFGDSSGPYEVEKVQLRDFGGWDHSKASSTCKVGIVLCAIYSLMLIPLPKSVIGQVESIIEILFGMGEK